MIYTTEIIRRLIKCINEDLGLYFLCTAIEGYEANTLPIPIKTTYFSLVPQEHKLTYFENENKEFCQRCSIIIRLNCYAPLRRKSVATHALTETVLDFLVDSFPDEIKSFTIGDTEYDDVVNAFKVTSRIYFEYETCAAEGSTSDAVTVPKNFFCKTHVTDTTVHVTEEEHNYLSEPFVTGSYTGSGSDLEHAITLGFKPRILFIFRNSYHPTEYDASAAVQKNYIGFTSGTKRSKGINLLSDGFSVTQFEEGATQTLLNISNVTYNYIAFK